MNGADFLLCVSTNYNGIKTSFKSYLYKSKMRFDEDVFHTTIINCYSTISNNDININSQDDVIKYLFSSFRMNIKRNSLYSDNRPKSEISTIERISNDDISTTCDVSLIYDIIAKNFDSFIAELYFEHLNGKNIEDLEIDHQVKNLKYKFSKIKKYLKVCGI